MAKYIENIPEAANLMGSLRCMGYSFESAVADVLDNSISANCKNIWIDFPSSPEICFVTILDDGHGMSKEELFKAMRYGSSSCEDDRAEKDMGRFGMGLKSASLSQCKKLTVVSKIQEELSAYSWDYDYLLDHPDEGWAIMELNDFEIEKVIGSDKLKQLACGSLVVWEKFDVLEKASGGLVYDTLIDNRNKLENYLGLIYHRHIDGGNVQIYVDKGKISSKDPFLSKSGKTWDKEKVVSIVLPDKNGKEHTVTAKPYVLPYISNLSKNDIKILGGIENLRNKQGFYIYRNRRLIQWGTWQGAYAKEELTKNVRIMIDFPNSLDDVWNIDVKKQNASIPKRILQQLQQKIAKAMNVSMKQPKRGPRNRQNANGEIDFVWDRIESDKEGFFYYTINRENCVIQSMMEKIPSEYHNYVESILKSVECSLPILNIYADQASNVLENTSLSAEDEVVVETLFQDVITSIDLYKKRMSTDEAIRRVVSSEHIQVQDEKIIKSLQNRIKNYYK